MTTLEYVGASTPSETDAVVASGAWMPAALPRSGLAQGTVDLVSTARTLTGNTVDGVRWLQGLTVWSDPCGALTVLDPCDMDPDPFTFGGFASYSLLPYHLIAGVKCSTFGMRPDEMNETARRLLTSGAASFTIERQLWGQPTGMAQPSNPTFRSAGTAVAGGAVDAVHALAVLEQTARSLAPGLGRYMIHASPGLVSLWNAGGALRKVGNSILTILDTVVVAGAGYDTTGGPGSATATSGQEYAFITGIVTVYLSEVLTQAEPALITDRTTNTIVATAVRFAVAAWPACLPPQGVLVTVSTP